MSVSYEQIGHISVTMTAGTCVDGQVCKVGTGGAADACAAGEKFCGVTEGIRGGYAGVQLHGFATVHYTGTPPQLGYINLSADGYGGVKVDSAGRQHLVVQVNTNNMTAIIEL